MQVVGDSLAPIRAALGNAQQAMGERGEFDIDTGLTYAVGDAIQIHVRKRGHRYDLSDAGAATARAGRPAGWFDELEHLVAPDGFNVNRRGVVFVPAVEGRDIAMLALRLASVSRTAYLSLLELRE